MTANGELRAVSRGLYAEPVALEDGEPWELVRAEHLERCRDWLARRPGHVASHQTAAIIHGLDLAVHPAQDVHLTSVDSCPRSERADGVQMHHADSIDNDWLELDGLRVTTMARTVADVLRTSKLPNGVAMLDQAIRAGVVTRSQVTHVVDRQRRWKGRPRAVEALRLSDGRRETWLESYSFVTLYEHGIPIPVPQVEVVDEGFHFLGRVDGLLGVVFLEADGQGKYLKAAYEQGIPEDRARRLAMTEQEHRHRLLESVGLIGVRWTTAEIRHRPDTVAGKVRAALEAADVSRFTGWLRQGSRFTRPAQQPLALVTA